MSFLVDTNVLLRSAQPTHPMHPDATRAVGLLLARGETLSVIPQNLIEYWAVATRPVEANGLGLGVADATAEIPRLKSVFRLLPDTPAIFKEWEALVASYAVRGKEVHDARIVAAMLAYKVPNLLTFNKDDFKRYTEITPIDPRNI